MRLPLPFAALGLLAVSSGCQTPPAAPVEATAAPPSLNGLIESGAARYAHTHPGFAWVAYDTANFRLYAENGPDVEGRLRVLGEEAERALETARAYVGRRYPVGRQSIFFVDARTRMKPLVGSTPGGLAVTQEATAFFAVPPDGSAAPPLIHELTHLEAWEAFGERPRDEQWLDEGLATAAVGRCYAYTLDEAGAAVVREGRAVPLRTLASAFDVADAADYLQAGSLMAWVRETWGLDAVAALWRGGLSASKKATGLEADALDEAWRAHVAAGDRGTRLDWDAIRAFGCEGAPEGG